MLGYVVLVGLTALAAFASLAWCVRVRFQGVAERTLAASILWNFLVLVPIYALGFTGHLTAAWLGVTSLLFSSAVLGAALWRGPPREVALATLRAARDVVELPVRALRESWRAKSIVFLAVLLALVLVVWSTVCAWYLPAWRGWDSVWYHETIVGFAIQTHSLGVFPIPLGGIQKINGYPRISELTMLWFVIFTDRRLIDLWTCLCAPFLPLGIFALTKRYSSDRVVAMGWGASVLAMQSCSNLLQSTYVDIQYAWMLVGTTYFATRPRLRVRDAVLTAICGTLLLGCKAHALVPVPMLMLIATWRLIRAHTARPRAVAATVAFGVVIIGAMFTSIYVRNWVAFHNPLWPDVKYDNPKYGIHWEGISPLGEQGQGALDMNYPLGQLLTDVLAAPYSWHKWHYTEVFDFGIAFPWVVLPLGLLAGAVVIFALVRAPLSPAWRVSEQTKNVAWLLPLLAAILYTSPALWAARYHVGTVALFMALLAWASGRKGWGKLGEGVVAIAFFSSLTGLAWGMRWWITPSDLKKIASIPYPEREVTHASVFAPDADPHVGSCVTREAGLARERELGPGSVLVFPENFGSFMALFWNDHYSNRIVWVHEGPTFIADAEAQNATWIYCNYGDPNYARLNAPDSHWEQVAPLNVENWGAVFRRKKGF